MNRCTALLAGGTLVAAATSRSYAQMPKLTTITIGSSPNVDMVTILYAQKSGLFAKAGFDINLFKMDNGTATAAALIGGSMDIGKLSAGPVIQGHTKGIDLPIVFPNKLRIPGPVVDSGLIVSSTGNIQSARDLNGKIVSCSALKDPTWLGASAWIDKNGGDSSSVKFIEVPMSLVLNSLEADRIQGGSVTEPFTSASLKSGKARLLGDSMDGIGGRVLQSGWCCTTAYAKAHPDVIAKFIGVIRTAAQYCNTHRDDVAELSAAYTGLDLALVKSMQVTFATEINPADLQPWVDASAKYKLIPQTFPAAELYLHP